jgi:hypothetical protein
MIIVASCFCLSADFSAAPVKQIEASGTKHVIIRVRLFIISHILENIEGGVSPTPRFY